MALGFLVNEPNTGVSVCSIQQQAALIMLDKQRIGMLCCDSLQGLPFYLTVNFIKPFN